MNFLHHGSIICNSYHLTCTGVLQHSERNTHCVRAGVVSSKAWGSSMDLPVDDIPQQVTIPQLSFRRLETCVKTQITFKTCGI